MTFSWGVNAELAVQNQPEHWWKGRTRITTVAFLFHYKRNVNELSVSQLMWMGDCRCLKLCSCWHCPVQWLSRCPQLHTVGLNELTSFIQFRSQKNLNLADRSTCMVKNEFFLAELCNRVGLTKQDEWMGGLFRKHCWEVYLRLCFCFLTFTWKGFFCFVLFC